MLYRDERIVINYIIHHDTAAVNTCSVCNGGLCKSCVQKQLKWFDKIVCESCFLVKANEAIAYGKNELAKFQNIKRKLTIILIVGLVIGFVVGCSVLLQNKGGVEQGIINVLFNFYYSAAFIWAFHTFFDGVDRHPREKSLEEQVRDAVIDAQMLHNSAIMA